MKKCLYLCVFILVLLAGCGNKMSDGMETTNDESDKVKDDRNIWEERIETDVVKSLFASAECKIEYGNDYVVYEKDGVKANLVYEQDGYFLSYESSSGSIQNTKLDIYPKMPIDLYFYEEDIDFDGYKELLVCCTHSTGSGTRVDSLNVIDFKNSSAVSVFAVNNKNVTFTDEQRAMILSVVSLWNDDGFSEKTGIDIGNDFKTELFVPSIVKNKDKIMVRVDFSTNMMNQKTSLRDDYISAIFSFKDNKLQLENMWKN